MTKEAGYIEMVVYINFVVYLIAESSNHMIHCLGSIVNEALICVQLAQQWQKKSKYIIVIVLF